MTTNKTISIYSDFDATISLLDVGDELFKKYGNWDELYEGFCNNMYNVREFNKLLCNSLRNDLTFEEIVSFATKQQIDPFFYKFVMFCKANNYNFTIVSDGYDAYIKPILDHNKLNFVPTYCNSLIKEKDMFVPNFFGAVEGCECPTASCKRNVVLNNSADEDIIVYIGDGHTDYCAAEYSDVVFAKSKLAAYCNLNRIAHHPFKNFFDIYQILNTKIKNNKLYHRSQAKMKRKSAFENE